MKDFDYSQSSVYFVTICTHDRAHLFGEIVTEPIESPLCGRPPALRCHPNYPDRIVTKWLFEIENKYANAEIVQYIIMPDHIHFIILNPGILDEQTGDHTGSPLPQMVDWFKTMTTNEYIKGVKAGLFPPFDKHIWQRSYYEHVIRNEEDYQKTATYIDENPQKWAIDHDAEAASPSLKE